MKTKTTAKSKIQTTEVLPLEFARSTRFRVQVRKHRDAVHWQFPTQTNQQRKLVDLALNEAEALAWQTPFPHLVYPVLAEEIAETLAKWREKQDAIRRNTLEDSPAD